MTATVMTNVDVVVQEGLACDEQAVYNVDGELTFAVANDENGNRVGVFICFVPRNGYGKGRPHRVPFERVLAIRDRLS